jgi:hypothetical protein
MDLNGVFRFRVAGQDHRIGDASCSGCKLVAGRSYPRPHAYYKSTCLGMIHAETLPDAVTQGLQTIYHCDVCNANPE